MKIRLLQNWTFRRGLYVCLGLLVIVQAIIEKQYLAILFGSYFAAMGLFDFGCASGVCMPNSKSLKSLETDIEFKEVN